MNNHAFRYTEDDSSDETSVGFSQIADRFSIRLQEQGSTGADIIELFSSTRRGAEKIPLWDYVVDNRPLSALVYLDSGYWFAEIEWLNVFGEGESQKAAVSDLKFHIDHFRNHYANEEDDCLTRYASDLKKKFARVVCK